MLCLIVIAQEVPRINAPLLVARNGSLYAVKHWDIINQTRLNAASLLYEGITMRSAFVCIVLLLGLIPIFVNRKYVKFAIPTIIFLALVLLTPWTTRYLYLPTLFLWTFALVSLDKPNLKTMFPIYVSVVFIHIIAWKSLCIL